MNLISQDYLMHHGVKGMKWGVRHDKPRGYSTTKNPPSGLTVIDRLRGEQYRLRNKNLAPSSNRRIERKAQAAGRKAEYQYNKAYGRKANQKQSLNEGLAAYEKKRNELEAESQAKIEKYRDKLTNKAKKNASSARAYARESTKEYNDLKNNGLKSEAWKNRSNEKAKQYVEKNGSFWGSIDAIAYSQSKSEHAAYTERVRVDAKEWNSIGRNWSKKQKNLMNMQITETTTKKDVKKVYKGK